MGSGATLCASVQLISNEAHLHEQLDSLSACQLLHQAEEAHRGLLHALSGLQAQPLPHDPAHKCMYSDTACVELVQGFLR